MVFFLPCKGTELLIGVDNGKTDDLLSITCLIFKEIHMKLIA
jgi:hypothetical protein